MHAKHRLKLENIYTSLYTALKNACKHRLTLENIYKFIYSSKECMQSKDSNLKIYTSLYTAKQRLK